MIHVHHIGSTSVPDLMAKPIIDMIPEVSNLHYLDTQNMKMDEWGYEVMGEYGIPRRRYFRKGGDNRTHHVHAFATDDPHIKRHLAFRDYLTAHKYIAKAYRKLKWDIAQRIQHDMGDYSDAKDPFIAKHERQALAWYD
ncbi:MAG: GrpB family protein [Bacteroidota bacterium]